MAEESTTPDLVERVREGFEAFARGDFVAPTGLPAPGAVRARTAPGAGSPVGATKSPRAKASKPSRTRSTRSGVVDSSAIPGVSRREAARNDREPPRGRGLSLLNPARR